MLSPTKKKYLFTIYELGSEGNEVRSIDIANSLKVKKATVYNMIELFVKRGYVEKEYRGTIKLNELVAKLGNDLYTKYLFINRFLSEKLNSNAEDARLDSIICLCNFTNDNIEHMIEACSANLTE